VTGASASGRACGPLKCDDTQTLSRPDCRWTEVGGMMAWWRQTPAVMVSNPYLSCAGGSPVDKRAPMRAPMRAPVRAGYPSTARQIQRLITTSFRDERCGRRPSRVWSANDDQSWVILPARPSMAAGPGRDRPRPHPTMGGIFVCDTAAVGKGGGRGVTGRQPPAGRSVLGQIEAQRRSQPPQNASRRRLFLFDVRHGVSSPRQSPHAWRLWTWASQTVYILNQRLVRSHRR
jgi:hypothetical protein